MGDYEELRKAVIEQGKIEEEKSQRRRHYSDMKMVNREAKKTVKKKQGYMADIDPRQVKNLAATEYMARADHERKLGHYGNSMLYLQKAVVTKFEDQNKDPNSRIKYMEAAERRMERTLSQAVKANRGGEVVNHIKYVDELKREIKAFRKGDIFSTLKSGLESKTAGAAAIIGFLGAAIFLSANITGNVIGSNSTSSNGIGVLSVLVGLVGSFFWLKSRN